MVDHLFGKGRQSFLGRIILDSPLIAPHELVSTTRFTLALRHAVSTLVVPSTAGLMSSSSGFLGIPLGKGEAV